MIDKEDILKEAKFLLLSLNEQEIEMIKSHMEEVLNDFNSSNKLNLEDIKELNFPNEIKPILREDISTEGDTIENIFKNTTNIDGREISIPAVI